MEVGVEVEVGVEDGGLSSEMKTGAKVNSIPWGITLIEGEMWGICWGVHWEGMWRDSQEV